MAELLSISIDVSKIDKSKLIEGKKGTYLNLTVSVNDTKDDYGNDVSAWQGQEEAERKSGTPKNYLGNGRKIWEGTQKTTQKEQPKTVSINDSDDDLPF